MNYKAIIYDIDGTLLNTFDQNIYPLQKVVKEILNKDMHYDELVHFTSHNGIEVLPQLGIDKDYYSLWVQYVNEYEHKPQLYDGILEVLNYYHDKKVPQAVVSSKRRKQYDIDFGDLNLRHYFQVSIMADEVEFTKPHPFPLNKCLQELGIEASEAIYIGDSIFDYQAAKAAGMAFGLATWGNITREGMNDIDYVFDHPKEIMELIK